MSKAYKDTLRLPRTDFPMKAGLTQREPEMLKRWESEDLYGKIQEARKDSPLYVLHDGPPFANGDVHMGTALNKILKDMVIKSRTMLGYRAPYVPGWDCHGLPIEFKVVKQSAGLSPVEVRNRSEAYARQYIDVQRRQFRRLGVLGEWENPYLTLDPEYEAEIIRAFGRFVEEGLVYQSQKPVLWSTGAQTALAEAEVEYQDKTSPAIFVRFEMTSGPFAESGDIVIWTTTPWTLPANLAIAVHPRHTYVLAHVRGKGMDGSIVVAKELLASVMENCGLELVEEVAEVKGEALDGARARHPFLDREASVHPAEFVVMDTGSGCVHIAPGHGEDDYHLGREKGLDLLSPVDDNGLFTEEVGLPELVGKYVFDANEQIIELLASNGRLLGREDYQHSYPHCWRSKTPVIFRAVKQFFIRVDDLRDDALKEIDNVDWIPNWGRNRIHGTVAARPDWCISRQRTWGVPLPVFYDDASEPVLDTEVIKKVADLVAEQGTNVWFELSDAEMAEKVGLPAGSTRRNDTLDVWIDSGVSHEAVTRKRLQFPADLYLEATDQHRGWFQSSLMTSVAMNGTAPYRTVLTHGFVVDLDGKKISKSGSYQKPMDAEHFVNKYGADLVRLWVGSVNFTADVPFSEEMFKRLGDVYRRLRNTLRILLANLHDYDGSTGKPTLADEWILARLAEVISRCRAAYEALDFHRVYEEVVLFCSNDLSSLYVDITKDRLYCDPAGSDRRRASQATMSTIFDSVSRLLAPILAFTAEEAWGYFGRDSVHLKELPSEADVRALPNALLDMKAILEIRALVSQEMDAAKKNGVLANSLEARVELKLAPGPLYDVAHRYRDQLEELLVLSHLVLEKGDQHSVSITRTNYSRCERCWRHYEEVGTLEDPALCSRCLEAVAESEAATVSDQA